MHMAAARLGCKRAMVGIEWSNSSPSCMNRCRKCYSHLFGDSFLAGKSAWPLSRYLPTEIADYCMLMRLKVHLGSVLESELRQKQRYCALKAKSSLKWKKLEFRG